MTLTPQEWHDRNHFVGYVVPLDSCWYCQRNQAICRSKVSYPDYATAEEAVQQVNREENWAKPVRRYRCRYCLRWHLTSQMNPTQARRVEKQRRRSLWREVT